VTVAYVDLVLRSHERERWAGTGSRIQERLAVHGTLTITAIRRSLGFGPDILDHEKMANSDLNVGRLEIARVAEHVLAPAVRSRLDKLNPAGWKTLAESLRGVWDGAERLIDRFGHRLEPSQLEVLMDIQQSVQSALFFWETFPELAGVPDEQLPATKTPPVDLKKHMYDGTTKDIRALLEHARKLVSTSISSRSK